MSKTVKKQKLTERQRLFAAEYLIDLNATRAYQAALSKLQEEGNGKR